MATPKRIAPALVALVALACVPPGHAAAEVFVSTIDDLPLMGGLAQDGGQDLLFDKPDGRIVEAVARGPVEAGAVRAFYQATLPQLGWRDTGPDRWARDGESLALEFPDPVPAARLTVRFRLSPL